MSPYSAGPIKRDRRTQGRVDQLDRQIIAVLQEDHPQSVRHVFYHMTNPRLPEPVEKSDKGYRHVQDRLTKLRRAGRVQYGWVADMSRRGYFVNTFTDAADFVRTMAGHYRGDLWQQSAFRCEVWTESRSIASVLQDLCEDLAVSLFPCGGFTSLSFAHSAAEQHNLSRDTRPLVVFYVGDYDPAGVTIDRVLQKELRQHLRDDIELDFRRLGINEDQVREYDLPTKPRKLGDKRSQHIAFTVEAEAMPGKVLRSIVRKEIEALLPQRALEVCRAAEDSERAHLEHIANMLERGAV